MLRDLTFTCFIDLIIVERYWLGDDVDLPELGRSIEFLPLLSSSLLRLAKTKSVNNDREHEYCAKLMLVDLPFYFMNVFFLRLRIYCI